jgi:hypothetical protein
MGREGERKERKEVKGGRESETKRTEIYTMKGK